MKQPLVSVIIATRNRPERLAKALASIAAQTIGPDNVEAIVVNDGGPSVAQVVRAHSNNLTIGLTELLNSGGVSHARNVAIDRARGKHFAFLDDDDLFAPDHLATGLGPLERDEADFVHPGAVVSDRWLESIPADVSKFRLKAYSHHWQMLQVANYLHTGSVIVRNFQDTSIRFDESLEVCEDWDLWIALALAGYRVMSIDKITSIYHQVKDFKGLVNEGHEIPSKFQLAYDYIHDKWPTDDPLVIAGRAWKNGIEQYRCDLVLAGHKPDYAFDDVLNYLYNRISRQQMPDPGDIRRFFAEQVQP